MSNTQKLTVNQIELLTRISNKDHYCCEWRNASGIDLWMDNLADLGLIQFVCDVKRLRFKLEITQAGLKALTK